MEIHALIKCELSASVWKTSSLVINSSYPPLVSVMEWILHQILFYRANVSLFFCRLWPLWMAKKVGEFCKIYPSCSQRYERCTKLGWLPLWQPQHVGTSRLIVMVSRMDTSVSWASKIVVARDIQHYLNFTTRRDVCFCPYSSNALAH